MDSVTVRYWAGLKEAAGTAQEEAAGDTLREVLEAVRERHDARFATVLGVCSVLVDGDPVGARDHRSVLVRPGSLVDCLPPFAGG
jgi:molybdopterin converting factor small subunit